VRGQATGQVALLQRVSDDLTGAVPGGDLATDTKLALQDATGISERLNSSSLCDKLRTPLLAKAKALVEADSALDQAGHGSGDVAAALQRAQAAYQDLDSAIKSAAAAASQLPRT
jgi:hypothetical protein